MMYAHTRLDAYPIFSPINHLKDLEVHHNWMNLCSASENSASQVRAFTARNLPAAPFPFAKAYLQATLGRFRFALILAALSRLTNPR